jgi:hypothetical protein
LVAIVTVVVAAAPLGVTDEGEKLHELFAGRPEQLKVTALLNPFCGVTLRVAVPVIPAAILREEGFAASVNVGVGAGPAPVTDMALDVLEL